MPVEPGPQPCRMDRIARRGPPIASSWTWHAASFVGLVYGSLHGEKCCWVVFGALGRWERLQMTCRGGHGLSVEASDGVCNCSLGPQVWAIQEPRLNPNILLFTQVCVMHGRSSERWRRRPGGERRGCARARLAPWAGGEGPRKRKAQRARRDRRPVM